MIFSTSPSLVPIIFIQIDQVKFMYTSMVDISNISPRVILKLLNAADTCQVDIASKEFID